MLTLDKIYQASHVLRSVIRKTDLIYAPKINPESEIYLKTENLQVTGSFKVRGAYYMMSQLSEEEKAKGVVACSAGNHAQGVALAAAKNHINAVICLPDGAPISKVEATKSYGAQVCMVEGVYDDAYAKALELKERKTIHSSIRLTMKMSLPDRAPLAWNCWIRCRMSMQSLSPSAAAD